VTEPRLSPLMLAVVGATPLLGAALFYVWAQVTTVTLGYALTEASAAQDSLVQQNHALKVDLAAVKSPEALKLLARERGFAPPAPDRVVKLEAP